MIRKITRILLIAAITAALAGCSASAEPAEGPSQAAEEQLCLSVGEYQEEVRGILDEIKEASADISYEDSSQVTELISVLKPLYEELAALVPPDSLSDEHAAIREICETNIHVLDLSEYILSIDSSSATSEDLAKVDELQEENSKLSSMQETFEDALEAIYSATAD